MFIAGASGVIGRRLVPLLVSEGHAIGGMTRSRDRVDALRALGAEPVVCDVFDAAALTAAFVAFAPDTVIHQVTDLPDDPSQILAQSERNARMRRRARAI